MREISDFWFEVILAALCAVCLIVALTSCGTTRDSQTKTVEKEELIFGPMVAEIPMLGQLVVQPTRVIRLRTQDEVTQEEKRINMPEGGALLTAAANTTPWGGIIGGVIALGTAAWGGKKAIEAGKAKRHFGEVVDGAERSKDVLSAIKLGKDPHTGEEITAWTHLASALEAEQSRDTQEAVKARVG